MELALRRAKAATPSSSTECWGLRPSIDDRRYNSQFGAEVGWEIEAGMTRDGTYLIDGGKVARAAVNVRFTQSIVAARVIKGQASARGLLFGGLLGAVLVPQGFRLMDVIFGLVLELCAAVRTGPGLVVSGGAV